MVEDCPAAADIPTFYCIVPLSSILNAIRDEYILEILPLTRAAITLVRLNPENKRILALAFVIC